MRVVVLLAAVGVLGVLAGCGGTVKRERAPIRPTYLGVRIPSDAPAADFALRDQNGDLVRLSAQRGHFVLLAFLYSHCRDVCPLIATWLDDAVRALGPRGRNIRVLAVSVDPEGDTPSAVRAFVRERRLGPEFHWLVGTRAQLAPVWQGYNILVEARSPEQIAHAAPVLLLDRSGRPRLFYATPKSGRPFRHDLRLMLGS